MYADGGPIALGREGPFVAGTSLFADAVAYRTDWADIKFEGSVLVIDKSALVGLTPTQLADYAAMR